MIDQEERPLISFIIPVYNSGRYIERCLEAIIAVSKGLNNIEVIIINDGSTDNSEIICRRYIANYSFLKLYSQKNKGASSARNQGLVKSNGKYIWFVDSDDTISTVNFSSIYDYLKLNNPEVVAFNYCEEKTQFLTEIKTINDFSIQTSSEYLMKNKRLYLWNKIYSREAIESIMFLEGTKNIEDFLFNVEVLIRNLQVHLLPITGYIYNTTNNVSTSRNRSNRNLIKLSHDSLRVHNRLQELLSEVDKENRNIVEELLNFGIGGHLFSILRYYNCRYLFKVIKVYKQGGLYPVKRTQNFKMNLFLAFVNKLGLFI